MIGTAIILGLGASLHCMLMCSPLALAVTGGGKHVLKKLLYNSGRIMTYAVLGAVAATLGKVANISGFQTSLTIVLAGVMLIMGIAGISGVRLPLISPVLAFVSSFVKKTFQRFLQKRTSLSVFLLGAVNGLLPCGVTYLALTYCLTVAGPLDGFNFMLWFGAGTLPGMLGLTSVLGILIRRFDISASRLMRLSYVLLGIVMLARLAVSNHEHLDHAVTNAVIIFCQ